LRLAAPLRQISEKVVKKDTSASSDGNVKTKKSKIKTPPPMIIMCPNSKMDNEIPEYRDIKEQEAAAGR
jgi:hypothetical protein